MRLPPWSVFAFAVLAVSVGCKKERPADTALRLAAFPNVTHAQALVGNADGTFARALGEKKVDLRFFNAGPAAMEALLSGSVDAAYVGSGPAVNTYVKGGHELQVIASAADGGAVFVTKSARSPAELRGKKVAVPQIGNTQDIALRCWLAQNGLKVGKDVEVIGVTNAEIVSLFERGEIEGGWVPEPWGSRMLEEGGHLLLDERSLWPGGHFDTTLLVTTKKALKERRPQLLALMKAHVELTRRWESDPKQFAARVNDGFFQVTSKRLDDTVLQNAFTRLTPSLRPSEERLKIAADHAKSLGYLPTDDVSGIVDSSLLDEVIGAPQPPATGGSGH